MTKDEFIGGYQYFYKGTTEPLMYVGGCPSQDVGKFKSNLGLYHYEYRNMRTHTQPELKYPNPPLPHYKQRIAHAMGANIEWRSHTCGAWKASKHPKWHSDFKYRVKVEKTIDDLRIEWLEANICSHENYIEENKKELAELKPTANY